jgi:hypothetical protein
MHQTQSSRYLLGFSMKNLQVAGRRYKQCFLLDKSSRKMYTIFSTVLRQQRKSGVSLRSQHRLLFAGSPNNRDAILQMVHDRFYKEVSPILFGLWYTTLTVVIELILDRMRNTNHILLNPVKPTQPLVFLFIKSHSITLHPLSQRKLHSWYYSLRQR